jgi:hypothetical protein
MATMDTADVQDRLDRLTAALVDIDAGRVTATRGERTYLQGARDALQALVEDPSED